MQQVGARPSLVNYLRDLWRHRSFLLTMASADFVSRHQQNVLGQIWVLLNPVLLGTAYYLVFGLLLGTDKGTDNYVAFLMIGLFAFLFLSSGMNYGAKSLVGNMGVVRALRFPRVVLPIAVVMTELLVSLPAFLIAAVLVVVTGGTPTWTWLLYPVAIFILYGLTTGIAMIAAVVVYQFRDTSNLVPLITRMLRYVSGVFFVIPAYAGGVLGLVLAYQPVAVVLTMLRQTLMEDVPLTWPVWAFSMGWALLFLVVGFIVFWRSEASYGRQ